VVFLGLVFAAVILFSVLTIVALNQRATAADQPAAAVTAEPVVTPIAASTLPAATQTTAPATLPPTSTALPAAVTTEVPPIVPEEPFISEPFTIGESVQGRPLLAYRLGHGSRQRALIGAIHGGYEWNTTVLLTTTLDYLSRHPEWIPPEVTLYILPLANPDGMAAGTDRVNGRMNARAVDLNRNWDYQWIMTATHGTRPVSAGQYPFSEPETVALRDFIDDYQIQDVIFYHSAFAAVFQGAGITTSQTVELAKLLAQATGYRYAPEGVPGQITTGDAIDWLTMQGVNAVEVELTTHQDIDWQQNLAGLQAFLKWELPEAASPPLESPARAAGAGQTVYTVQDGDTLGGIALKFGVTVEELVQANQLADPNSILVGQALIIPQP
jgi:LysM repeat protein